MRREALRARDDTDDVIRAIHRLKRADPEEQAGAMERYPLEKDAKRCGIDEIASIRSEVDPCENHFPIAGIANAINLRQHL